MAIDVIGDLGVWFSDFAEPAPTSYQAMVAGVPSGAPVPCTVLDATDGKFVSVGHVASAQYSRIYLLRVDQVAAPTEGSTLTVGATVYKISAPPRFSDATRSMWLVPVR